MGSLYPKDFKSKTITLNRRHSLDIFTFQNPNTRLGQQVTQVLQKYKSKYMTVLRI